MYANIKIITAKERCDSKAYVDGPISPSVEGEDTALKLFTRKDWRFQNLDKSTMSGAEVTMVPVKLFQV